MASLPPATTYGVLPNAVSGYPFTVLIYPYMEEQSLHDEIDRIHKLHLAQPNGKQPTVLEQQYVRQPTEPSTHRPIECRHSSAPATNVRGTRFLIIAETHWVRFRLDRGILRGCKVCGIP